MFKLKNVFSENHKPAATRIFNRLAESCKLRNDTEMDEVYLIPELPTLRLRYMVDDYEEIFGKDDTGE
jgi:hypothetical protein